jgi:hypothetical protein
MMSADKTNKKSQADDGLALLFVYLGRSDGRGWLVSAAGVEHLIYGADEVL